jgi:hypothetical protein
VTGVRSPKVAHSKASAEEVGRAKQLTRSVRAWGRGDEIDSGAEQRPKNCAKNLREHGLRVARFPLQNKAILV